MLNSDNNLRALKRLRGTVTWIDCQELFEKEIVCFRVDGKLDGFSIAVCDDGRVFDADRFGGRSSFPGLKRIVIEPLDREEILSSVFYYEAHTNTKVMSQEERSEWDALSAKRKKDEEEREKERKRLELESKQREYERLKEELGK